VVLVNGAENVNVFSFAFKEVVVAYLASKFVPPSCNVVAFKVPYKRAPVEPTDHLILPPI
jgi:hypothetical protein